MRRISTAIGAGMIVGMVSAGLLVIGSLAIASATEPEPEIPEIPEILCPEVDFTYPHERQAWEEDRLSYCWYTDDPTKSPAGGEPIKLEGEPLPTLKGFVLCPPGGHPYPRDYPPDPPLTGCWDINDPTQTPIDPADWRGPSRVLCRTGRAELSTERRPLLGKKRIGATATPSALDP